MRQCPVCDSQLNEGQTACPCCGFRLLGKTERINPIKLTPDGAVQVEPVAQEYDLRIIRGPMTGSDIALHPGMLTIGRDPRCDIFLNDMTVSRHHATLEVGPEGAVIRDEGSMNGVWVNDRMSETCVLRPGDLLQIGAFCLTYQKRAARTLPQV